MNPRRIAAELGVTTKEVRQFLRATYGKPTQGFPRSHRLDDAKLAAIRAHFAK